MYLSSLFTNVTYQYQYFFPQKSDLFSKKGTFGKKGDQKVTLFLRKSPKGTRVPLGTLNRRNIGCIKHHKVSARSLLEYTSDKCQYETKFKTCLRKHIPSKQDEIVLSCHKDSAPSHLDYTCDKCKYESKF